MPDRSELQERIRRRDWQNERLPRHPATTMLKPAELSLLRFLARCYYDDCGTIVDGGCFLGGSTLALADGLRARHEVTGRVPSQPIQSYDLFEVEPWTIGNLLPSTVQPGESFRPLYEQAIAPVRDLVEIHEGNIATTWRPGGPIELLFIDLAKCPEVNDFLVQTLFPCLIPGTSILIQQDYLYADWNAWIHISMESLDPYFDQLTDTGSGSVVYALRQAIPPEAIAAATVTAMAAEAKQAAMSRARARWGGRQREMLRRSHARYLCGPVWFTGLDRDGHERVLRREIELDLDRLRTHARGRAAAIREVDALAERLAATPFEQLGALAAPELQALGRRVGMTQPLFLASAPTRPTRLLPSTLRWWLSAWRQRMRSTFRRVA